MKFYESCAPPDVNEKVIHLVPLPQALVGPRVMWRDLDLLSDVVVHLSHSSGDHLHRHLVHSRNTGHRSRLGGGEVMVLSTSSTNEVGRGLYNRLHRGRTERDCALVCSEGSGVDMEVLNGDVCEHVDLQCPARAVDNLSHSWAV